MRSPDDGIARFGCATIVRRLGEARAARLPCRSYRRWGALLHVIEDRSDRLTPYWRDQALVRERLLRLFPRHAVRHALIDEGWTSRSSSVYPVASIAAIARRRRVDWRWCLATLGLAREDARVSAGWERLGRCLAMPVAEPCSVAAAACGVRHDRSLLAIAILGARVGRARS